MNTIAVIKTGGKQYIIEEGMKLRVEKLLGKVGETVGFGKVLLMSDKQGELVKLGFPTVEGALVEGTILEQARAPKVTVIKFKRKVRYKRKRGHRQPYTLVRIARISSS